MEQANNTLAVKETVIISTIGRKQAPIREMLAKCIPQRNKSFTNIYTYENNWWRNTYIQPSRPMDTIFMPKESKEALVHSVDEFLNSKDFYQKHAIPYRMGLAFHGVPGTGKTSMVRALCHYLGRDLYIISLVKTDDNSFVCALNSVSDNAIILIEDIDTYDHCSSRETPTAGQPHSSGDPLTKVMEGLSGLTLSGILNAIDGVVTINDRILVMTTNHFDHLDPALKRKGRIDFDLEFDYLNDETFRAMMARIYPTFIVPVEFKIADNVAPADMQSIILEFKNDPESVLKRLARRTT
jgi:AAA+ superfamily predicted ATPase